MISRRSRASSDAGTSAVRPGEHAREHRRLLRAGHQQQDRPGLVELAERQRHALGRRLGRVADAHRDALGVQHRVARGTARRCGRRAPCRSARCRARCRRAPPRRPPRPPRSRGRPRAGARSRPGASSVSVARRCVDSGSSGGTPRSSPYQRCTSRQSGSSARAAVGLADGVEPPESATCASPRIVRAAAIAVASTSAAAAGRLLDGLAAGDDRLWLIAQAPGGGCRAAAARAASCWSARITCITALISARWVNACGKLPRWRPERASISSA